MLQLLDKGIFYIMKLNLVFIILINTVALQAQQKPYYTQVVMNNYILNPAISGIENYTDVKISYRNQWTNLDGAPVTSYISLHGSLNKKTITTTPTSFDMDGENPRGKSYVDEYTAPPPHHGIGFVLMNDKTGFLNRITAYGTYAYHLPLNEKTTLSAGTQLGYSTIKLDRTKAVWGSLDPNDPAISYDNGDLRKTKLELGVGLWLYGAKYYAGISVLNIVPGKVKFDAINKNGDNFKPHLFATVGYKLFLSDDVSILPSIGAQYISPQPTMYMANAKVQYRSLIWAGVNYRYSDILGGLSAMVGLNISNTVNISYAYDNATSNRLKSYVGNTHEFIIGFLLGNSYGDGCPKNVW